MGTVVGKGGMWGNWWSAVKLGVAVGRVGGAVVEVVVVVVVVVVVAMVVVMGRMVDEELVGKHRLGGEG